MSSLRHLSRELVLQALFSFNFSNDQKLTKEEAFSYVIQEFGKELTETKFALSIFEGVLSHATELDTLIVKYAPEWPLEKIAHVDRTVLQIGLYELSYSSDVPPVVAINEAVELSKEYGDLNTSKFINGVLNTFAQEHNKLKNV
jgi:N utilization substance protein B